MDTIVTSFVRRAGAWWRSLARRPVAATTVPAYAALARYRLGATALESRLRLIVTQLAADRSECRWCIERGQHLWREALLPRDLLRALDQYETSSLFSPRERAALAFADAVTRFTAAAGGMPEEPLAAVRRYFSEHEVAALTEAVAAVHFFNPITGALGADADPPPSRAVWNAPRGSAARNLWL